MSSGPADQNVRRTDSIDALFRREDVRRVLAALDIGALYPRVSYATQPRNCCVTGCCTCPPG